MKYIKDLTNLKLNNTVVTIGKFDGNHIGHQYLFDAVARLKEYAMDAVIFTFSDDIKKVAPNDKIPESPEISSVNKAFVSEEKVAESVSPASDEVVESNRTSIKDKSAAEAKKSIFTNFEKENYSYPDEIDYVIECNFSDDIKDMYPEEFIEKILVGKLGVKKIVVGNDFCFGRNRSGDVRTLFEYSDRFKYEVFPMEKILYDGIEVSSTYIKEKILEGDMEAVRAMLGEAFCITGEVVHGKELGREIGFPTINLIADDKKILPPDGVYATRTEITYDGKATATSSSDSNASLDDPNCNGSQVKIYDSISNIGKQPTIDDNLERTVETHIFNINEDLYGKTVKVSFYKFIRPEKKFAGLDDLKAEISVNKEEVMRFFGNMDQI